MTYFTRATLSKGVIAHVRHCLALPQYFCGLCFRYGQENFTPLFGSSGCDNSFLRRFGSRSRSSSSSPRSSFLFCFSCAGLLVLFPEAPDFELDEDAELEDLFSAWPPASVLSQFIIGIVNSLLVDDVLRVLLVFSSFKGPEAELTSSLLPPR
jgi:hypothetical protein